MRLRECRTYSVSHHRNLLLRQRDGAPHGVEVGFEKHKGLCGLQGTLRYVQEPPELLESGDGLTPVFEKLSSVLCQQEEIVLVLV